MDGVSMLYAAEDAKAKDRRVTQYFEMFGNRGIYHDGWTAVTRHSTPWLMLPNLPKFDQDVWELYKVDEDFSQSKNLAAENPEKLKELKELFDKEAVRNHVYPLDDRRSERFNAEIAGRPDLIGNRKTMTLFPGMEGLMENAFINIKYKPFSIRADVVVPEGGAEGVIVSQAGRFGGWSLYMKEGRLHHVYNYGGLEWYKASSDQKVEPGARTVSYQFTPDGPKPGMGGKSELYLDGKLVGEVRVEKTMPFMFSADEGVDVGKDNETPVTNDYAEGNNSFTGSVGKIVVELK
jgi:arylsulfatase